MANSSNFSERLIDELLDTVECRNELKKSIENFHHHVGRTMNDCLEQCYRKNRKLDSELMLKIDSIVDYVEDNINIGHWSDISVELRRIYTLASYIKTVIYLKSCSYNITVENLREALKYVDKGLLIGAPFLKNSDLLTTAAKILTIHIRKYFNEIILGQPDEPKINDSSSQYEFLFQNIEALVVDHLVLPSLQQFNRSFFETQRPVKLQGCIDHWPAKKKWKNLQYLLEVAGDRTVPVEIGTQYIDENWSQKLMTIREFVEGYYTHKGADIGYLAQHNLFDQIPELREDICIPEYCCLSKDYDQTCEPDINCWFGPAGTVSSLHYDPKNNLLVQVYGTKQLILFSPEDTEFLYPFEGKMLSNTSQVDPLIPDLELYPDFIKATKYKCLLKEGDILFIPERWWHHVVALDKSFSVSFWWR